MGASRCDRAIRDASLSAARRVRVALEELANDGTDATALARGPRRGATVQVRRQADGDPRRVDARCLAEGWSTSSRCPGLEVKVLFEARGQPLDIGLCELPTALGRYRSYHLITRS